MSKMIQDKITKARFAIMRDQPFYATILLQFDLVADHAIDTTRTDGRVIRYNPGWIDGASDQALKTKLAKAAMHIGLEHPLRLGDRDVGLANQAMDHVVNPLLKEAGFTLPNDAQINPQFADKTWEQVYAVLKEMDAEQQRQNQDHDDNDQEQSQGASPSPSSEGSGQSQPDQGDQDGGDGGSGDDDNGQPSPSDEVEPQAGDNGEPLSSEEQSEAEADLKVLLSQAAQAARRAGKLGADLERTVQAQLQPTVDWRAVLQRFIRDRARDGYSWSRPNKRMAWQGLILPSQHSQELGEALIVVDTSSSIPEDKLTAFQAEVRSVFEEVRPSAVTVIYCDTGVRHHQRFTRIDEIEFKPKGGGGTLFQPAFDWVDDNMDVQPDFAIFFTDLESADDPLEPDYPVLWAVHKADPRKAEPFGEVVSIA